MRQRTRLLPFRPITLTDKPRIPLGMLTCCCHAQVFQLGLQAFLMGASGAALCTHYTASAVALRDLLPWLPIQVSRLPNHLGELVKVRVILFPALCLEQRVL